MSPRCLNLSINDPHWNYVLPAAEQEDEQEDKTIARQQKHPNTGTFRFLDLPWELRHIIYRYALPLGTDIFFRRLAWNESKSPALFLVNRQLSIESNRVFFYNTYVDISTLVSNMRSPEVNIRNLGSAFIDAPLPRLISHSQFGNIRRLAIYLWGYEASVKYGRNKLWFSTGSKHHARVARGLGLVLQQIPRIDRLFVRIVADADADEDFDVMFEEVWKVRNVGKATVTRSTHGGLRSDRNLQRLERLLMQRAPDTSVSALNVRAGAYTGGLPGAGDARFTPTTFDFASTADSGLYLRTHLDEHT